MRTKTLFFSIILLFSIAEIMNAQAVERFIRSKVNVATGRAAERADEEVDKKINNSVDKGIDNLLEKMEEDKDQTENASEKTQEESQRASGSQRGSSPSSARSNALLKSLGLDAPANISEAYNYTGYIVMDIENWDSKGKKEDVTYYSTYFNETEKSFAMEFSEPGKGHSVIIFDADNKLMLILSDDGKDKSGMVTPLNYDAVNDYEDDESATADSDSSWENPNYKKTGKKKTVSGYQCEEYLYEDEESIMSLWITNDLPADLYARMFSVNAFASYAYTGYAKGFTMEWDLKKKNSEERTIMTVKEVDKNKKTSIKTGGYNIINLGGLIKEEQ